MLFKLKHIYDVFLKLGMLKARLAPVKTDKFIIGGIGQDRLSQKFSGDAGNSEYDCCFSHVAYFSLKYNKHVKPQLVRIFVVLWKSSLQIEKSYTWIWMRFTPL